MNISLFGLEDLRYFFGLDISPYRHTVLIDLLARGHRLDLNPLLGAGAAWLLQVFVADPRAPKGRHEIIDSWSLTLWSFLCLGVRILSWRLVIRNLHEDEPRAALVPDLLLKLEKLEAGLVAD